MGILPGRSSLTSGLKRRVLAKEPLDIMQELEDKRCILIQGAPETGKTTLLQWLVARSKADRIIVFDPKVLPKDKWGRAEVVGANGEVEQMEPRMQALVKEMKAGGTGKPTLVVIDELFNIMTDSRETVRGMWRLITLALNPAIAWP